MTTDEPIETAPETPEPPEPPEPPEMPYIVGTWNGLPNYKCAFCPHATLDENVAITHFIERHAPKPAPTPPPSDILIADRRGKQIN